MNPDGWTIFSFLHGSFHSTMPENKDDFENFSSYSEQNMDQESSKFSDMGPEL
jgi:hypothetical protein